MPSADMQQANHALHRVKVYKLRADGHWTDKGTGHVSVEELPRSEALGLVVLSETDNRTLLIHRISPGDVSYTRQTGDTIITWNEPGSGAEVALSFEDLTGCNYVWDHVQQVQSGVHHRHAQGNDAHQRRAPVDECDQVQGPPEGNANCIGPASPVELPPPDISKLEDIARVLQEVQVFQKEQVALQLRKDGYINKLLEIFQQLEDLEDHEGLNKMYRIIKSAIMLNDTSLYDEMFKEENVMSVVGALEYDPELKVKQNHRDFLRDKVLFKEVVPIKDPVVKQKIHQTYRMGYLKDVILPRVLDDSTFATFHSMMLFNYMDVLQALHGDPDFLNDLFKELKSHKHSDPVWPDLVAFTQELCQLAKSLQAHTRQELFAKLIRLGLFEVETAIMQHGSPEVRLKATDILLSLLQHDTSPLRHFLLVKPHTLLTTLVQNVLAGGSSGLPEQIMQMLKMLLDPETMEQNAQKNEFLEMFYAEYMPVFLQALSPPASSSASQPNAEQKASTDGARNAAQQDATAKPSSTPEPYVLALIIDLFCFCVQNHFYHIKYFILRNKVIEQVFNLLKRPEKWLVTAAIRFLRTCLGIKDDDEFYSRYLLRNNLFKPVIDAFMENGNRYNLLNSAVLELMEFVRKENMKKVVAHIVENFGPILRTVDYIDTFRNLEARYEQNKQLEEDAARGPVVEDPATRLHQRKRRDDRELEREEEDYFTRDDDDDSTSSDSGHGNAAHRPNASDRQQHGAPHAFARTIQGNGSAALPSTSPQSTPTIDNVLAPLVDYGDDDDGDNSDRPAAAHVPVGPPSSSDQRQELPAKRSAEGDEDCQAPLSKLARTHSSDGVHAASQQPLMDSLTDEFVGPPKPPRPAR